jgi:FMN phosphatase YigB (HAD superfamily)
MKYLAVDLGNVVIEVSFEKFMQDLMVVVPFSFDECFNYLCRVSKSHDLGLISIVDGLQDHFNFKLSQNQQIFITNSWKNTVKSNVFMNEYLNELTNSGTKIALLSNMGFEHRKLMRDIITTNVYDTAIKFFSCDVGAIKPTYIYYKTFLDMYPEFKGCIYLDDKIENIEASKLFGFDARQFILDKIEPKDKIKQKLSQLVI